MTKAPLDLGTSGLRELAVMLGISAERVRQLAADGVIAKVARDKFDIERSVQGYIRFLHDEAQRRSNPAKDRFMQAKCAAVEGRIARLIEQLIDVEDVEAVNADIVATFRQEFAGLGKRCGGGHVLAARIDLQIESAIARCAHALAGVTLVPQRRQK